MFFLKAKVFSICKINSRKMEAESISSMKIISISCSEKSIQMNIFYLCRKTTQGITLHKSNLFITQKVSTNGRLKHSNRQIFIISFSKTISSSYSIKAKEYRKCLEKSGYFQWTSYIFLSIIQQICKLRS